jgi:hypothetical protein
MPRRMARQTPCLASAIDGMVPKPSRVRRGWPRSFASGPAPCPLESVWQHRNKTALLEREASKAALANGDRK